ncbi:MAG: TonB-dependent receptor [Bacteroidota bacterium]
MKNLSIITFLLLLALGAWGQTETIKGKVTIKGLGIPESSGVIMIKGTKFGSYVDSLGNYQIKNVPLGRVELVCQTFSDTVYSEALLLTSAKALIYDFEVRPYEIPGGNQEYTIPKLPTNPANLGGQSFTIEDVQRSGPTVNDPARYATTLPGVQPVRDDNSDIIIRGNAPTGLLWRLEGIDIPNPNHFARKGNTGGGITMFSAQLLGKSDFSTGAFSAEYGNALSGVFDMNFRNGDLNNRESRLKIGLLGIDFATEGPFKKSSKPGQPARNSYLVNYRYSTLGILNNLGYRLLNPRISNTFQDLSFNLYFNSKDGSSNLKVFGVGGTSQEYWDEISDSLTFARTFRTTRDFLTTMGTVGATYTKLINEKSVFKATAAAIYNQVQDFDDTLDISSTLAPLPETRFETEDYRNLKLTTHLRYINYLNKNISFKAGLTASLLQFSVDHEVRDLDSSYQSFKTLVNGDGSSYLLQPYAQLSYQGKRIAINGGLHALYLGLNNTSSLEPRLNVKYNLGRNTSVFAAYGLHGRTLPLGNYFTQIVGEGGIISSPNRELAIMKAHHFVVGLDQVFNVNDRPFARVSLQVYNQELFNIPETVDQTSSFWLLNQRDGYATEELESTGRGRNRGVDLAVQKFFNGGFYGQLSGSVYQSTYESNFNGGTEFSTKYDGRYNGSLLMGKEFGLGKKEKEVKNGSRGLLTIATRAIYSGGLRFSPGDPILSAELGQPVIPAETAFTSQLNDYFRIDLRIAYRKSFKKTAIEFSLDVQNVFNRENDREELWNPVTNNFFIEKQSGLIPVFSFQFDF